MGIGTASAPEEKLHVNGNLKVTESITSNSLVTTELESNTLNVHNATINNSLKATTASINNDITVGKDVIVRGKLAIGMEIPTEVLDVNGNLKLTGEINAGQNLNVAGNSILNNVEVNGFFVSKNFAAENLNTSGNATVGQNLSVTGVSTVNALNVNGQLTGNDLSVDQISTSGNVNIGQNLIVNGAGRFDEMEINGSSTVSGDLHVAGTLNAGSFTLSHINTNGNATVNQNLTVGGQSQLTGDVNVAGTIKAGVVEATEFRTSGGGSPFNFENAVISQTVAIASERVPENYRMAVGGNIIATGIDIKIPQKWPDYVFTDGHKLLTIEEVADFIKEHGHLPNVLSAKEMEEKKNYSVSEMDGKLLEKIEEMMLYIIQLKNEIEVLKRQTSSR